MLACARGAFKSAMCSARRAPSACRSLRALRVQNIIPFVVQGESADKKLAQGDVPPLLLKNEESGGPEFAFGFLKMWKLRLPLFIDHGLASISLAIIAIPPQIIR